MKHIFFWLLCFHAGIACAQTITISATVQDKVTGESLPYASVGIKNKAVGTITNLQGQFDFHLPREFQNEILVISMLGYENFESPVWSLLSSSARIIQMNKSTTILNEVVVADSLSGSEIFGIALNRIEHNFPMQPFMYDAFYRDVKKVGGTYIALLEAAVKVFDENYSAPRNKFKLRERVKLLEIRKSLGYDNKFTTYFGQNNLLEGLLLHNAIRYRQIDATDKFLSLLKRDKNTFYDGHEVFVVSAQSHFSLRVFIDKTDYAILHLEYTTKESGESLAKKKKLVSKSIEYRKTIDFKRFDGRMYLNYITVTSKEDWHDIKTQELKFQTELIQSLLVNSVSPNTKQRISSTEKMKNYGLQYQDYPYNKPFWDDYNVIKETPLDEQIRGDLEKLLPLEKQFQDF